MRVSPEELALGPETLVARYAGARGGGVLQLLAVQPGDLRKVPASGRGGAGGIGTGEEPAVERERIGDREPRRVAIRAGVEEEEEEHQGGCGDGPNPAGMRRPRGHRLRGGHGIEFRGTGMPNLRGGLGNLACFRGSEVRVWSSERVVWELGIDDDVGKETACCPGRMPRQEANGTVVVKWAGLD